MAATFEKDLKDLDGKRLSKSQTLHSGNKEFLLSMMGRLIH